MKKKKNNEDQKVFLCRVHSLKCLDCARAKSRVCMRFTQRTFAEMTPVQITHSRPLPLTMAKTNRANLGEIVRK